MALDTSHWHVQESADDIHRRTRPDVCVYYDSPDTQKLVIPPEDFLKLKMRSMTDEEKQLRKDHVGRRSYPDLLAFVEIKVEHEKSAFEFNSPADCVSRADTALGKLAMGQFEEYLAATWAHQHRTHLFSSPDVLRRF